MLVDEQQLIHHKHGTNKIVQLYIRSGQRKKKIAVREYAQKRR